MKYFPEFVLLKNQKVLIVGGGVAAAQKVRALKPFEPVFILVSRFFTDELEEDAELTLIHEEFSEDLLKDSAMVIAATDDTELNHRISRLASERKIPCNCVDDQDWCSFIFPALVQDQDLVIGISTGGSSPTAARWLKKQIGSVLPDDFGTVLDWLKRQRPVIRREFDDQHTRALVFKDLFEQCLEKGVPLSDQEFEYLLRDYQKPEEDLPVKPERPGEVVLAGAGCGSSNLLTEEVRRLLQKAPVLVYDDLVDESVLSLSSASNQIYVGKRGGKPSMKQSEINELLLKLAYEYRLVLRLKGGDPFVFGRGMEEMLFLKEHGIQCHECSGIPSFLQVPARFGIPLTHRGLADRFLVMTGTNARENVQTDKWKSLGSFNGSLLILMGLHNLEQITWELMEGGMDPMRPAAVLSSESISVSRGCFAPLKDLAKEARRKKMVSPAIVMISETVGLAKEWKDVQKDTIPVYFASSKRFMKRINSHLPSFMEEKIALVLHQKKDLEALRQAVDSLDRNQGIVCLTSPYGAKIFLQAILDSGRDLRSLAGQKICVIGQGTAEEFLQAGIRPDLMPDTYSTVHLAKAINDQLPSDLSVVALRSKEGNERMEKLLQTSHPTERFDIYTTEFEPVLSLEELNRHPGVLVFGSRGCIHAWKSTFGKLPEKGEFVVLSDECAEELQKLTDENLDKRILISARPAPEQTAQAIEKAAERLEQYK